MIERCPSGSYTYSIEEDPDDVEPDLPPEHFGERHSLFVIIAIGEALIVAAGSVTGMPMTESLIILCIAFAGILIIAVIEQRTLKLTLVEALEV